MEHMVYKGNGDVGDRVARQPPFLNGVDRVVGRVLDGMSGLSFVVLFLMLTANVFFRHVPVFSMAWFDEIVEMAFAYMVFFGAASLWRRREHFRIDWLEERLAQRPRVKGIVLFLVSVVSLLFLAYLFWYGLRLFQRTSETTPIFAIPKRLLYLCIPVSAGIMGAYEIVRLVKSILVLVAPTKSRLAG